MKRLNYPVLFFLLLILAAGCAGGGSTAKKQVSEADTVSVPDTGYTGIKKYFSGTYLTKEVTFRNGIKQGEARTYYKGGQLYQTFNYVNNLREDSAKWYYTEGQVFRSTPYRHDTVDGTQIQYYRTGRVKAKLKYVKGLRTTFLEEYTLNGKRITGYPEITYDFVDNYASTGKVRLNLTVSNKLSKVKFYRGELSDGNIFDTAKCQKIKIIGGNNFVDLKKTGKEGPGYIGIIAAIVTDFGNNYLTYKKIELPYKDLE